MPIWNLVVLRDMAHVWSRRPNYLVDMVFRPPVVRSYFLKNVKIVTMSDALNYIKNSTFKVCFKFISSYIVIYIVILLKNIFTSTDMEIDDSGDGI